MTGQEKCDLLIQVTAWAGVTTFTFIFITFYNDKIATTKPHIFVGGLRLTYKKCMQKFTKQHTTFSIELILLVRSVSWDKTCPVGCKLFSLCSTSANREAKFDGA